MWLRRNEYGQLGLGDNKHRGDDPNEMGDYLNITNIDPNRTAVEISAGQSHTCAILDDGNVKCWG